MEAQRLAILCSHLRPIALGGPARPPPLSLANCASRLDNEQPLHDSRRDSLRDDCVFCRIIRDESPAFKLYEDDNCLCILDSRPLSHGNAIMKATGCDSFNLLVNNGAAAGQVIFHTHIHIIPRKALDCLWASESLRRRSLNLEEEASELAKRIGDLILVESTRDGGGQSASSTEH